MEKRKVFDFDEVIDGKQRLSEVDSSDDTETVPLTEGPAPIQDEGFIEPIYLGEGVASKEKASKKNTKWNLIIKEIGLYVALVLFCIYIIPTYVVQRTLVEGESMENSLYNGENVLVDKVSYHFQEPKRFEIIVFYPNGKGNGKYFVKRIIGMPGETVEIVDGDIYIDGDKLSEGYGKNAITRSGLASSPITLGEDEYFVLGDNRLISKDSRYSSVGPVKREDIEGRVWLRIWPFDSFGTVK